MQLIISLAQSELSKIKLGTMYLIEIICDYAFDDELLVKHSQTLSQIFLKFLEDKDIEVILKKNNFL
jgi:hypothetical protein